VRRSGNILTGRSSSIQILHVGTSDNLDILAAHIIKYSSPLHKAVAWAKPSQGQAVPVCGASGFGLAQTLKKPKPPQARPKPGLLARQITRHYRHYTSLLQSAADCGRSPKVC
jgi:hypothetical protein